ncbi:hypothetical protein CR513_20633, partial [Mucuna pruriens]
MNSASHDNCHGKAVVFHQRWPSTEGFVHQRVPDTGQSSLAIGRYPIPGLASIQPTGCPTKAPWKHQLTDFRWSLVTSLGDKVLRINALTVQRSYLAVLSIHRVTRHPKDIPSIHSETYSPKDVLRHSSVHRVIHHPMNIFCIHKEAICPKDVLSIHRGTQHPKTQSRVHRRTQCAKTFLSSKEVIVLKITRVGIFEEVKNTCLKVRGNNLESYRNLRTRSEHTSSIQRPKLRLLETKNDGILLCMLQ